MADKGNIDIGGSSFWILMSLIAITTLIFLMIWSFHNNSVKGVVVSVIFATMILSSIIFSRSKVFDLAKWGDNTLSFSIGFILWTFAGSLFGGQSIISISQNNLFATIASELPQVMEFSLNTLLIPIAEEMFWMVGLPFALITIFTIAGKRIKFLANPFLQIAIVTLIGALTFAMFHVGKFFIAFIVVAMLFRTIMMVLVYGDRQWDFLKGINLVTGFAVGGHMANNMGTVGFSESWLIITSNFFPIGLLIIAFFVLMFASGIDRAIGLLTGKQKLTSEVFVGAKK